ncbi:MAG: helix-turn-helix transcriptional regulator, partial [Tepidanaerobacteraceae bacterium]
MKLDRLLSILMLLLRKDRVKAKELAEKFEVSTRTILRDIDAINLAGIPVVTYQGVNGGIGIAEGYRLDRGILTSDEMISIIISLKGMARLIPESQHDVLLEKLKNVLNSSQLESIESKTKQLIIDPSPWFNVDKINEMLTVFKKAIEEKKEVRFRYIDSNCNETDRQVEPYFLILKGQNWYLYAFCLLRRDFRLFKFSRIKDFQVTEHLFEPRTISEEQTFLQQGWQTAGDPIALELS